MDLDDTAPQIRATVTEFRVTNIVTNTRIYNIIPISVKYVINS